MAHEKGFSFIITCQVEATAALLTSSASNRSLNWVFVFIYLSENKTEKESCSNC